MRTSSRPLRVAAALLALGLTAAACGGSDSATDADTAPLATSPAPDATTGATDAPADDTTAAPADTATPAPSETTAPNEPVAVPTALQFTAPLVGGGEFDGATVAGKPTLFWFWAPT